MFRRNLIVVFKPIKSNSVILSEANHRLLSLNKNEISCLNLSDNRNVSHYIACESYGGQNIRDTEIGINALVAQEIGLFEGDIISCKQIQDVQTISSVQVMASNQKDWEMLEVSSYRIQNTMLEQTRIINKGQRLVVWVNKAMHITLIIEELCPDMKFGKIASDTELIVAPYHKIDGITTISSSELMKNHRNRRSLHESSLLPNNEQISDSIIANGHTKRNSFIHSNSISSLPMLRTDNAESAIAANRNATILPEAVSIDPPLLIETSDYVHTKPIHADGHISTVTAIEKQCQPFNSLVANLRTQFQKQYQFRVISSKWEEAQMCDLFITKSNIPESLDIDQVYRIQIKQKITTDPLALANIDTDDAGASKEFYVNIKAVADNDQSPCQNYPSIEMNDVLMAYLQLHQLDRITLSAVQPTPLNTANRIELVPSKTIDGFRDCRIIEDSFKQLILDNTKLFPILINQQQLFRLNDGEFIVSVKIYPETVRYCLCDSEILRKCKIACTEDVRDVSTLMKMAERISQSIAEEQSETQSFIAIEKFQDIVSECTEQIIFDLCLNDRNSFRKVANSLIIGNQNSGKTQIVRLILNKLKVAPYYCYSTIFHCARNKGRKPESIQRDLRNMFLKCLDYTPAILVLDNLDILTQKVVEQTQDDEYYNRVSDVISQLISEYTLNYPIAVIATVTSKNNLNQKIYMPKGKHLFQFIHQIPSLVKTDRAAILQELCKRANTHIIDYDRFARLTEGYSIADLVDLIDRAMFYAHRNYTIERKLTQENLLSSLKATNEYCLHGIENNTLNDDNENSEGSCMNGDIPGLKSVVSVLEEVLIWPSKYPGVFEQSPLRNQAGVLLFGAPGTGKTMLVRQIAHTWKLRIIPVKGPELLAKYIGQSEENVRKLFQKARNAKPCVLFFDEFDSLAPRRGHDSTGVTDRVVNQLLTELDGVEGLQGVVVIAATSRPELLDPALLRSGRIDRMIECKLPNRQTRRQIFETLAKEADLCLDEDVDFQCFCDERTDYYTGADIQSILISANMIAVKECLSNQQQDVAKAVVEQKHILEAFDSTRPSLSKNDVMRYNQTYAKFLNKEKSTKDILAQRATLA